MKQELFAAKPGAGQAWDVVIVGSGPAALTAAIYTTRGAASTLVLGGEKWGGQLMLTTTVDNFPALPGIQGPDLMQKMREHAVQFGAEFIEKNVEAVDFSGKPFKLTAGGQEYLASSVIVATGADTKWLGVPGEDKLIGRGVSSCAPCDAPFFKGKAVAVVGGGDSAMEEALVLTKYASQVAIIHRRDKFRASEAMQKKVFEQEKAGKIKMIWNSEVVEMLGDEKLTALKVKNNQDNSVSEMPFDGVFVAIGHSPSTSVFRGKVNLDEKGYVKTTPSERFLMSTNIPGIFVSGDVHDYLYRQAITAAGFGCMAALDVLKYLDKDVPNW